MKPRALVDKLLESPIQPVGRVQPTRREKEWAPYEQYVDRKMHAECAELLKLSNLTPDDRQSLHIYQSMRFLTRLHRMQFDRIKSTYAQYLGA